MTTGRRIACGAAATAFLAALLVAGPAAPFAHAEKNVVAAGHGLDVGLLGARYARRAGGGRFSYGIGVGLAGLSPKVAVHPLELGSWNVNLAVGALYAPIENPLFSGGSAVGYGIVGVERWAYRDDTAALFARGGLGIARQFTGHAEGGALRWEPTVELQLGLSF